MDDLIWFGGPIVWLALLAWLGRRGAARAAITAALVPLAFTIWFGLDAYVLDPYDIAQTYVPLVGTAAFIFTWAGVGCYALGRLLRSRTAP